MLRFLYFLIGLLFFSLTSFFERLVIYFNIETILNLLIFYKSFLKSFYPSYFSLIGNLFPFVWADFIFVLFVFFILIKYFLFKNISKKKITKIGTLEQLKKMNWSNYEEFIKKIFESRGYSVQRVGGNGADGGIDLIVKKRKKTFMVQCKRYTGNVGVKVIREMFGVCIHHGFNGVYIYTSSDFTKEAYNFAKGKNIYLINGEKTLKEIKNI